MSSLSWTSRSFESAKLLYTCRFGSLVVKMNFPPKNTVFRHFYVHVGVDVHFYLFSQCQSFKLRELTNGKLPLIMSEQTKMLYSTSINIKLTGHCNLCFCLLKFFYLGKFLSKLRNQTLLHLFLSTKLLKQRLSFLLSETYTIFPSFARSTDDENMPYKRRT